MIHQHIEQHTATWEGITLCIRYTPEYFQHCKPLGYPLGHLSIKSVSPAQSPLPITETGYRSHFLNGQDVDTHGGAVAYVLAWLDDASHTPIWQKQKATAAQLELF